MINFLQREVIARTLLPKSIRAYLTTNVPFIGPKIIRQKYILYSSINFEFFFLLNNAVETSIVNFQILSSSKSNRALK